MLPKYSTQIHVDFRAVLASSRSWMAVQRATWHRAMLGFIETKPPARMQVMLFVFLVLVQAQDSVASPLRDIRLTKTSVSGHVRMGTGKMRR
jgi:hypothetical protein